MAYSVASTRPTPRGSPQSSFEPTEHPAGSAEKIEVMRRRVAAGQPLFHPLDNPETVGPPAPQTGGPAQRCPGVSRRRGGREGRRYRARLWLAEEGHDRHLGYHDTEEQAVRAVALAREQLAGC